MTEPTSGPWYVMKFREAHSGRHTAFVGRSPMHRICNLPYTDKNADEQKANAQLIAAAPAMLALVERLRGWDDLPGRSDGPFWIEECDKVIAKAKGEQP